MTNRRRQWYMSGRLGRKPRNALPLRKRFLIVTNGETEQGYFEEFRNTTGPVVIIVKKPIDPRKLVVRAVAERSSRQKKTAIDEVWVVMDRDTNPENAKDEEQFDEAIQLAKKEKINVAYSNDCFELWLVLHFQDLTASTHRKDLCSLLEKHIGKKYKKSDIKNIHDSIKHLRTDALARSKSLALKSKDVKKSWHVNPNTNIHELIEKLMDDPGNRG